MDRLDLLANRIEAALQEHGISARVAGGQYAHNAVRLAVEIIDTPPAQPRQAGNFTAPNAQAIYGLGWAFLAAEEQRKKREAEEWANRVQYENDHVGGG